MWQDDTMFCSLPVSPPKHLRWTKLLCSPKLNARSESWSTSSRFLEQEASLLKFSPLPSAENLLRNPPDASPIHASTTSRHLPPWTSSQVPPRAPPQGSSITEEMRVTRFRAKAFTTAIFEVVPPVGPSMGPIDHDVIRRATNETSLILKLLSKLPYIKVSSSIPAAENSVKSRRKLLIAEDDDDVPIGFLTSTTNKMACSTTYEPSRPIMIVVEPSTPHDDCVSLNDDDSLFDVGSCPAVGSTAPSSHPHTKSSHDSLKGTGYTHVDYIMIANPPPPRENLSEPVANFHLPRRILSRFHRIRRVHSLGGTTDVLLFVESHDTFSVGYLVDKIKDPPLPLERLALFDSLHPDSATLPFSDLGYPPSSQGLVEPQAVLKPIICVAPFSMNVMVTSKVASTRASFNSTGELIP